MAKLQEGQTPNFFDATNMTSVPRKKLDAGDPILYYRIYHFQSCPTLSNPVQSCPILFKCQISDVVDKCFVVAFIGLESRR